jgi:hypothetical protein
MEASSERNEEKEAEDSNNKSNLVYLTAMEADVCALDSSPIVHIKGEKNSYRALLDSGSAVNVICRRLIPGKIKIRDTDVVLKSAGGDKMGVLGKVRLSFWWNDTEFTEEFIVVNKMSYEIILGRPFLRRNKLTLSWKEGFEVFSIDECIQSVK